MGNSIEKFINRIHQGDCIELMRQLDDECIDLIFADPPYFLQLKANYTGPTRQRWMRLRTSGTSSRSFDEYDEFTYNWLKECGRF